ncbi:acyltransferase family protein [Nitratireductor soli]|uniref:acyltransferase family protein n=1 Tax=Nitratireductor soli TaxID=1670619 RepID=UPI00065E0F37|nr:acyltransferase family protein [Nitratireductor soli]
MNPENTLLAQNSSRRHDLDWLRVIAFGLLILYHVGMFYVTWDWHVKSPHASRFLEPAMVLVNPWRLALLFFISGVALRFALDKARYGTQNGTQRKNGIAAFARARFVRLFLPIAFGMLVLVVPQSYFELLTKGEIEPGYWRFYPAYLDLEQHFSIITPTWNHLWYVVYLLIYTLLIVAVSPWLGRLAAGRGERLFAWLLRGPTGLRLFVVPALPFIAYRFVLAPHFPTTHALVDDWANHANNLTVLLLGYLAAKSPFFWQAIAAARVRALTTTLAFAALLTVAYLNAGWVRQNDVLITAFHTLRTLYAWLAILTLLGLAQRWLDRPGPLLAYLSGAIFPCYILHQTLIVVIGYALAGMRLPVAAEAGIVTGGTVAGCLVLYETIRRVGPLRPLFGLPWRKPEHSSGQAAAPVRPRRRVTST